MINMRFFHGINCIGTSYSEVAEKKVQNFFWPFFGHWPFYGNSKSTYYGAVLSFKKSASGM
jgi:hypothetical protein